MNGCLSICPWPVQHWEWCVEFIPFFLASSCTKTKSSGSRCSFSSGCIVYLKKIYIYGSRLLYFMQPLDRIKQSKFNKKNFFKEGVPCLLPKVSWCRVWLIYNMWLIRTSSMEKWMDVFQCSHLHPVPHLHKGTSGMEGSGSTGVQVGAIIVVDNLHIVYTVRLKDRHTEMETWITVSLKLDLERSTWRIGWVAHSFCFCLLVWWWNAWGQKWGGGKNETVNDHTFFSFTFWQYIQYKKKKIDHRTNPNDPTNKSIWLGLKCWTFPTLSPCHSSAPLLPHCSDSLCVLTPQMCALKPFILLPEWRNMVSMLAGVLFILHVEKMSENENNC